MYEHKAELIGVFPLIEQHNPQWINLSVGLSPQMDPRPPKDRSCVTFVGLFSSD
ncbi:hypothetical protein MJ258_08605 [Legionella sp. EUR-108]|uniref:Uncharacterized protein n=1 Tax=Legionella maioricensis TaxID=2896528 RepID=A0A9X2IAX4_9GAMM|nr:hypothetical protein [Legionella maioricensis]MCL9687575.1 hypothetical protein [Legionella maioricensis]